MREIINAKITKYNLGFEDHDIFTLYILLEFDGGGQGFGGNCLDEPEKDSNGRFVERVGTSFGCQYLMEVLRTLELRDYSELVNTVVRIDHEHTKIHGIGNALKDKWFYPDKLADKYYPKETPDEK